ncbi:MAG: hypothetical protein ABJ275_06890 [Maricaulaceae bacterium]
MTGKIDLTATHKPLETALATRRYFAKFERIMAHLSEVIRRSEGDYEISELEADVLGYYIHGLTTSFTALSYKYLMAQRVGRANPATLLNIDKSDSGFPVYQEILQMASDALQVKDHLKSLPDEARLKQEMVTHILDERTAPTQLQYAMSQRLYYESLSGGNLFLAQNHPKAVWKKGHTAKTRRDYVVHWAVYDSQANLPVVYIMDLVDVGRRPLPYDERRWPRLQDSLLAQSLSSLTLLTIAKGLDEDYDNLYPMRLRRFNLGPMYSHAFTTQTGPLRDILAEASGTPGLDWTLSWRIETLVSESAKSEKTGIFSKAQRQIYKLDKLNPEATLAGASHVARSLVIPHRAFQVLAEKDPVGFRKVRKYVVGENGQILNHN